MRSAAEVFAGMFSIGDGRIRPAKLESLIVSLLHTLSSNDLLDEAVEDIAKLTDLKLSNKDGLVYVKSVTQTPEMVGLYNKSKALQLMLKLLPHIKLTDQYSHVVIEMSIVTSIINRKNKSHIHTEMKKILQAINHLKLGYKIIQKPRDSALNEFHIVKFKDRHEMLDILRRHRLLNPSVLDKILDKGSR